MYITHGQLINEKIRSEAVMSDLDFFSKEIVAWKASEPRLEAITADKYYKGDHDILNRRRTTFNSEGKEIETKRLPNNRVVDNQYGKLVDQKKNYLLSKEITFDSDNAEYISALKKIFNRRAMRSIKLCGQNAINGGISWIFPDITKDEIKFRVFPAYEILPFWKNSEHTELDCAVRYYTAEYYDVDKTKKTLELVEIYKTTGVERYRLEGGTLHPEEELVPYLSTNDGLFNWDRVPLIPVKANPREIPLIKRCKELQDSINLVWSNFVNLTDQNPYNMVLIVKNYSGTDAECVWDKVAKDGVINVDTIDGVPGDVDKLQIDVNADNYKTVIDCLKRAMIENCRGFDAKDDRLSGNPNQMNIQSMYSDIDLDANDMENEFQGAFEELLWFVNKYLKLAGLGDFSGTDVDVIFNRDILINESEAIANCRDSAGVISQHTIIAQHPWTRDVKKELKLIEDESKEPDENYDGAFPPNRMDINAE
ncbi:MAG: phage portal protein [Clostridia bacterium]|nr:phage portal protein [Clostridia bacterium]